MKKLVYGLALLVLPAIANANYSCAGTVNNLALNPDGVLTATIGSLQNVYLCQIGATRNGVSSDVCKAIFAHLLSARTTGTLVQLQFSDSLTCTTHPAWSNLTGWYYGPDFQ